ncbi:hypothetical protein [Pseudoduganella sp. HUAS MS19]
MVRAAILLCALLPATQAQACPAQGARPVTLLGELPPEVLRLLGRLDMPQPAIADIGERFNPSDLLYPGSPPQRRLVSGIAAKDCVALKVEFGGIAYFTEQVEFQHTWRGWVKTRGSYDTRTITPAAALAP